MVFVRGKGGFYLFLAIALAGCRLGFEHEPLGADSGPAIDSAPALAVDAAPDAAPSFSGPYCESMPFLTTTPTLDGVVEPGLVPEAIDPPLLWSNPSEDILPGHETRYAVAALPDGMYFFIHSDNPVRQPPTESQEIYCSDGLEIYLDSDAQLQPPEVYPDNYQSDAIQIIFAAPVDDLTPSTRTMRYRSGVSLGEFTGDFATIPVSGGYVVEAIVRASDIGIASWTPMSATQIAFNIGINLSRDDASPATACNTFLGQYTLNDDPTNDLRRPFEYTSTFCVAEIE